MARSVRFTKPEREYIRKLFGMFGKAEKLKESILAKLDASERPEEKQPGMSVHEAFNAFRAVLRHRLIMPPSGAAGVFAMMTKRIRALGLTPADCARIAAQADKEWKTGSIKAQSLINQAETLLQHAGDGELEVTLYPVPGMPVTGHKADFMELDEL